jgi:hypothetical protein
LVEDSPQTPECPRCGGETQGGGCRRCDPGLGAIELRVVGGGGPPASPDEIVPPEVDLVREYKGPTVNEVLAAPPGVLDLLPGQVRSMEQAIGDSDLGEADRQMDRALGLLLRGPGHRASRRSTGVVPMVLWLWFAVLLCLLIWVLS